MSPRDRHLFASGPKKILAIDGGGTRGALALGLLKRLEEERGGGREDFVLADHFDLVGGTSTGAIIATTIALGWRVDRIIDFYLRLSPSVFTSRWWRVPGLAARYQVQALKQLLEAELLEQTLDTDNLLTGLAIVMRRLDTGGSWLVINNPRGKYWETPADQSYIGNRHYRLSQLVRASAAAPTFFAPERIQIAPQPSPAGLFVDGALTPHNNPALLLLLAASMKGHGLCWPRGEDALELVSVGTGRFRSTMSQRMWTNNLAGVLGVRALVSALGAGDDLIQLILQSLSEPKNAAHIDGEFGSLLGEMIVDKPLFRFLRLNVDLEQQILSGIMGRPFGAQEVQMLRRIDNPSACSLLVEAGYRAATEHLANDEHPASF